MTTRTEHDVISVHALSKTFRVPVRDTGLSAAVRSVFRRHRRVVRAVDEISFDIRAGESVGFLGPNGAGKTTTIKMLCGLLHPTSGTVRVLGHEPARRRREFLRAITLVMGNRNQLQWDLPAEDSFELHRAIYQIPWSEYRRTRDELVALLEVGDLVRKPVRNLSLGERMRVELIASLLHSPSVLFLDEPTIGLDVTMQKRLRAFLGEYRARSGATVLLTSHYMADVVALCRRVLLIDKGTVLLDDELARIRDRLVTHKEVEVTLTAPADLSGYGHVVDVDGDRVRLRVPRGEITTATMHLLANHEITDVSVIDPPIEDVIEMVFNGQTSSC